MPLSLTAPNHSCLNIAVLTHLEKVAVDVYANIPVVRRRYKLAAAPDMLEDIEKPSEMENIEDPFGSDHENNSLLTNDVHDIADINKGSAEDEVIGDTECISSERSSSGKRKRHKDICELASESEKSFQRQIAQLHRDMQAKSSEAGLLVWSLRNETWATDALAAAQQVILAQQTFIEIIQAHRLAPNDDKSEDEHDKEENIDAPKRHFKKKLKVSAFSIYCNYICSTLLRGCFYDVSFYFLTEFDRPFRFLSQTLKPEPCLPQKSLIDWGQIVAPSISEVAAVEHAEGEKNPMSTMDSIPSNQSRRKHKGPLPSHLEITQANEFISQTTKNGRKLAKFQPREEYFSTYSTSAKDRAMKGHSSTNNA